MTEQRGGSRVGLCASASKERVGAGKLQRFDCLLTGPVKSRLYSTLGDSQVPFWVSLGLVDRRKWSESHCSRGYLERLEEINTVLNSREAYACLLFIMTMTETVFDPFCKFLQLNKPLVHISRRKLEAFIRKMQDCFIKPTQTGNELPSRVKHSVKAYQVDDESLIVGDKVRDYFKRLSV